MRLGAGKSGKSAQDWALRKDAKRQKNTEIIWDDGYLTSNIAAASNIEPSLNLNAKTQPAE